MGLFIAGDPWRLRDYPLPAGTEVCPTHGIPRYFPGVSRDRSPVRLDLEDPISRENGLETARSIYCALHLYELWICDNGMEVRCNAARDPHARIVCYPDRD